ncbi:hypothetical protein [Selenomonas sputigena]|uniref:hypothetical protein n=1 Tax=Selenomonas sputigena TaxID=69823 RepID=UPI002234C60F|nr:hypothetical protein [Selenomonas sputigena]UZE45941.1 hypothetical protein OL236_03165 [Selenomonas sputigena]
MSQESKREYARETYHWRKEHGVCVKCGKEDAEPGKTLCAECAEKQSVHNKRYWGSLDAEKRQKIIRQTRERSRAQREQRKNLGLCVICGKKAAKGKAHCIECLLKERRRNFERYNTRRVKTDFSEGLCCCCNEPALPDKKFCKKHYDIAQRRAEKARKSQDITKHTWKQDNRLIFIKQKK